MQATVDRRVIIGMGALAAIGIGAAVAFGLLRGEPDPAPPPASAGTGLQIEIGEVDRAQLDPTKPIRCFVEGKFVGMATLSVCAERNGVSAQALDVGLDQSGAVVASQDLTFSTPSDVAAVVPSEVDLTPAALPAIEPVAGGGAPVETCLKFGADGWSTISQAAPLSVCVNLLFDGRCEQPGNAQYGRWGGQTVRLVPGKIEIAEVDAGSFRTLVDQGPNCTVPRI